MALFDDLLFRAAIAGLGVAFAAAPLGCIVVWRRMAYFGDATAHAGVLGVALSLSLSLPLFPGVVIAALIMGLIVASLGGRSLSEDTLLGVMAHGALAIGLVAVSLVPGTRVDLSALLLGDILAVGVADIAIIWGGAFFVVALIAWRWQALLTTTLDPDLAAAAGLSPLRELRLLTLALAVTVAIAIQIVGVLLVAALMIIPAAAARPFSGTPEKMVALSAVVGALSVFGGLAASLYLDTPTGPSIVCIATLIFAVSSMVSAVSGRR